MAKIYFYYGSMQSGKSSLLIQNAYNYQSRNMETLIFKPLFDTRDSSTPKVSSRIGLTRDAIGLSEDAYTSHLTMKKHLHPGLAAVFVDEVQFLTVEVLEELSLYCQSHDIPLLCYGLRNSFDWKGFPAADWLLRNADKLVELKSVCWCGSKATHNALVIDGEFKTTMKGTNMVLGDDIYVPLCFKHFVNEQLK